MDEEIDNKNYLIKIIIYLFLAFIIIYVSNKTGYYEYKTYTKTRLTNESISKFESDVKEGIDVNINDYVVNEYNDYSNVLSKTGSKLSSLCENIMNKGIKKTLKILSELFYE